MIKLTISLSTYKSIMRYMDEVKEYNYILRNREKRRYHWEKTKRGYKQDKW